jgi:hypothetical protein
LLYEIARCQNLCSGRKQPLEQYAVEFRVEVGTAIPDHSDSIVCIARFHQGLQHHATGGDAKQNQRLDLLGAEDHLKVGSANALRRCLVTTMSSGSGPNAG